ncbi:MAG: bestrophin family ion channel [Cyclobacteriaceae bacterium]
MIQYNPKTWLSLIFDVYSRYVIRLLFPLILFIAIYTSFLCYFIIDYFKFEFAGTLAVHSIMGVVLGLFLVIRTNTAYDRWWEGRKLWGQLVNDTRNMALRLNAYLPAEDLETRAFFGRMIPNITFAMKAHLRDSILVGEMEFVDDGLRNEVVASAHRPNIINRSMYNRTQELYRKGLLSGEQLFLLDKELKGFTDIIGACERIKNTPIPYSYSMFIKKFIFVYNMTLPFGFMWAIGYATIPIVILVFYFLVSIELIAEEIEDPFGKDVNDLPLDSLCVKIKNNVEEIFTLPTSSDTKV